MDIRVAALKTLETLNQTQWHSEKMVLDGSPDGFQHVKWMLEGIELGYIQHEKAHRWLGWAQCAICTNQKGASLELFKDINKSA